MAARNLPATMVPGKPGLVQLKLYSVRLPSAGFACAGRAAADDAFVGGDAEVHLGGEAVGEEAGHREPAAGVEQDADGFGDGGELDAFDGAGVGAGEGAGIVEGEGGGGVLGEGGGGGDADGGVGGDALGVERLPLSSVSCGDAAGRC